MMRNITITLDEDTAAWTRVQAAQREMSISRFIAEMLHERRSQRGRYEEALEAFLEEKPLKLRKSARDRFLTREQANDRTGLRRR
jgi:hypothetical protein